MPEKSAFTLLLEEIAYDSRLPSKKAEQLLRIIRRKIRRLKIHNIISKFLKM
ncbi:MAG: hypothetical protein ABF497_04365 [Sporolactobacillus sp.]